MLKCHSLEQQLWDCKRLCAKTQRMHVLLVGVRPHRFRASTASQKYRGRQVSIRHNSIDDA